MLALAVLILNPPITSKGVRPVGSLRSYGAKTEPSSLPYRLFSG